MNQLHQLVLNSFHHLHRRISPRPVLRGTILASAYAVILAASFFLAYEFRWDFDVPESFADQRWNLIAPILICKIILLANAGQFRSVFSYFSLHDFSRIVMSVAAANGIMLALWYFSEASAAPPRGVILIDSILSVAGLCGLRLTLRLLKSHTWEPEEIGPAKRVGIIGAGDMGAALVSDLLAKRNWGMKPVFFLDDDPKKWERHLHGIPITGPISRLPEIAERLRITEAIITIPSAGPKKLKDITDLAHNSGVKLNIVPSFTQLAAGDVKVERFRPVELGDLLGRTSAVLDSEKIDQMLCGSVVMVTGAGGSIGSELCRQIADRRPAKLLLVEQSEVQLFQIEQELIEAGHADCVVPLIADILDTPRVHEIFHRFRPSIVFHAAAHKHVVMMERQPAEAVKNNFFGTFRLAQIASNFRVERFVLISSDKAINPTNVMGASKRLAEYAIQGVRNHPNNKTIFVAVRFGNVLGSSGSVIPIFKRQIAAGGPVTVTHPDVTRYFMTIPEAVGLVQQAGTMGTGSEVFILDMGTPIKIVDVARQLIKLSGFRPDIDVEIKVIGLRPGEKLFEELQHTRENMAETDHPRISRLVGGSLSSDQVNDCLAELSDSLYTLSANDLKELIRKWVPEYRPHLDGNKPEPGESRVDTTKANSTN